MHTQPFHPVVLGDPSSLSRDLKAATNKWTIMIKRDAEISELAKLEGCGLTHFMLSEKCCSLKTCLDFHVLACDFTVLVTMVLWFL